MQISHLSSGLLPRVRRVWTFGSCWMRFGKLYKLRKIHTFPLMFHGDTQTTSLVFKRYKNRPFRTVQTIRKKNGFYPSN